MISQEDVENIIKDFSKLPSLEAFYYSTFSVLEERKYRVLNTGLNLTLKVTYDMSSSKYYYRLKLEEDWGRSVKLEDVFEKLPLDVSEWIIFNFNFFGRKK